MTNILILNTVLKDYKPSVSSVQENIDKKDRGLIFFSNRPNK